MPPRLPNEPYHIARLDVEDRGAVEAVCHTLVVTALSAMTGTAAEEIEVTTRFKPPEPGDAFNFYAAGMWFATVDRTRSPLRVIQPAKGTGVN